jgi:hypothetical protein
MSKYRKHATQDKSIQFKTLKYQGTAKNLPRQSSNQLLIITAYIGLHLIHFSHSDRSALGTT